MTFDVNKPVQTRDGRAARIICTDWKAPPSRIIILVEVSPNYEKQETRYPNGQYLSNKKSPDDLINIPEKRWVNIYENDEGIFAGESTFPSFEAANRDSETAISEHIACVPFNKGDGL